MEQENIFSIRNVQNIDGLIEKKLKIINKKNTGLKEYIVSLINKNKGYSYLNKKLNILLGNECEAFIQWLKVIENMYKNREENFQITDKENEFDYNDEKRKKSFNNPVNSVKVLKLNSEKGEFEESYRLPHELNDISIKNIMTSSDSDDEMPELENIDDELREEIENHIEKPKKQNIDDPLGEKIENRIEKPKSKNKSPRCKFWPKCTRVDCFYSHPPTQCNFFPKCKTGKTCEFGHPVCKYNQKCTNNCCSFYHDPINIFDLDNKIKPQPFIPPINKGLTTEKNNFNRNDENYYINMNYKN